MDDDRVINTLATLLTSKGQGSSAADWIDDNCPELFTGMHKCLVGWLRGEEVGFLEVGAWEVGVVNVYREVCTLKRNIGEKRRHKQKRSSSTVVRWPSAR